MDTRKCGKCGEEKLLSDFYMLNSRTRAKRCKQCCDAKNKPTELTKKIPEFADEIPDGRFTDRGYIEHYYGVKNEISYE